MLHERPEAGRLILVRHGQASLHEDDYDRLSPLGATQARMTGAELARARLAVDACYVGPRRRHGDTLAALAEGAGAAGLPLPEAQVLPELDEIEVAGLLGEALRRVTPTCPDLREQLATGALDARGAEALRHVSGITAKLLDRWASGEELGLGVEPYEAFARRARSALHRILRTERRGRTVLVVTSAGPIAAVVRLALDIHPVRSMALVRRLVNGSLTELRYTEDELVLDGFNHHAHLLAASLVTRI